jgi:peptidoglycan/xylan/chitin deacetylase (PgdA/CDA1 family)
VAWISNLTQDASLHTLAAATRGASTRSRHRAGIVLLYHDVAEVTGDPRRSPVPALGIDMLRKQLRLVADHYEVVSVHELRECIGRRRAGDRFPVALTFDDDVASHVTLVAPLLSELGLPATFFLTGSTLDGPSAFWWQDLQELYSRGGAAWDKVRGEVERRWPGQGRDLDVHTLARTIENLRPEQRDSMAAALRTIVASPPTDSGLSAADVRALVAGNFEIGFHTRRHYVMQALDDDTLHRELHEGVDRLAAIAGQPIRTIAFPHSRPGDLRMAAAAVRAGFELGFLSNQLAVSGASHPLLLERISGWQTSLGRFQWRLAREISRVS